MSEYLATVSWRRGADEDFARGKYSRVHRWDFDGGASVAASPSPHIVPAPWSSTECVDPEEAFVAALSSCHMLFFLHLASRRRFVLEEYVDDAVGVLAEDADGRQSMTRVTLRPRLTWSGEQQPGREDIEQLHHEAHQHCFIANSVKTEIVIESGG